MKLLVIAHIAFWLSMIADLWSTRYSISKGAVEVNSFAGQGLKGQLRVVVVSGAVIEALALFCAKARFSGVASGFLFVVAGVHGYLYFSNMRVAKRQIAKH